MYKFVIAMNNYDSVIKYRIYMFSLFKILIIYSLRYIGKVGSLICPPVLNYETYDRSITLLLVHGYLRLYICNKSLMIDYHTNHIKSY